PHLPRAERVAEVRRGAARAAVAVDRLEPLLGALDEDLGRDEDERDAPDVRREEVPDEAHVVEQGEPREGDVALAEPGAEADRLDVCEERPVREHDALGRPRAARRVLDERRGVGVDGRYVVERALLAEELAREDDAREALLRLASLRTGEAEDRDELL